MSLDEDTLERVANDGGMNYEKWPGLVEPLLERINQIVYTDFPVPRPFPTTNRTRNPISPQLQSRGHQDSSQTNTPTANGSVILSTPTPTRNLPPVPLFPNSSTSNTPSTSQIPDSLPPTQSFSHNEVRSELPPPLLQLLNGTIKTIRSNFLAYPPHTIQRLAELILHPNTHYRTLPAWLRAIDRVVSVTSSAEIFPLPRAMPLPSHVIDSSLLANGVHGEIDNGVTGTDGGGILWLNDPERDRRNGFDNTGLGSDESLGGALLTPIPWLKDGIAPGSGGEASGLETEGDDENDDLLGGPINLPATGSSDPMVPEREDGAVTQGELIRQEQEAGVVPVGHGPINTSDFGPEDGGMLVDEDDGNDEEGEDVPHARGPGTVGMVDVGRVGGRAVEVNISRTNPRGKGDDGARTVERGVRDAQEVLRGGVGSVQDADSGSGSDEMQLDVPDAPASTSLSQGMQQLLNQHSATPPLTDGDVVLADADAESEVTQGGDGTAGEGAANARS